MNIVLAITGASGALYAQRVLQGLVAEGVHTHLVVSPLGRRLIYDELGMESIDLPTLAGTPDLPAGIAIALGMTIATAMIAVGMDVSDRMNQELRAYGANIVVYPQEDTLDVQVGGVNLKPATAGAYLQESDLP